MIYFAGAVLAAYGGARHAAESLSDLSDDHDLGLADVLRANHHALNCGLSVNLLARNSS